MLRLICIDFVIDCRCFVQSKNHTNRLLNRFIKSHNRFTNTQNRFGHKLKVHCDFKKVLSIDLPIDCVQDSDLAILMLIEVPIDLFVFAWKVLTWCLVQSISQSIATKLNMIEILTIDCPIDCVCHRSSYFSNII